MAKFLAVIDRIAARFLNDVNDQAVGGIPILLTSGNPVGGQIGDVAYLSAADALKLSDLTLTQLLFGAAPIASATFSTPTLTITGVFPTYSAAWIGLKATVVGMTNSANNGTFVITGGSTTTLQITNSAGVAQAGAAGTVQGPAVSADSLFEGLYQYVQTPATIVDESPDGIQSLSGTAPSMTLNGYFPLYVAGWIGGTVTIAGAKNAGNNGTFTITGGSTTTLTFQNANGVAEYFPVSPTSVGFGPGGTTSVLSIANTQPVAGNLAFWANRENYQVDANTPATQTYGAFAGVYISAPTLGYNHWIQIAGKANVLFSSVVTDTTLGDLVVADQTPLATANTIADATTVTAKILKSAIGVALQIPAPQTLTLVQLTRSPLF